MPDTGDGDDGTIAHKPQSITLVGFGSDPEDGQSIEAAAAPIVTVGDYERGWAIEQALAELEAQITEHYTPTRTMLNGLVTSFRQMVAGDLDPVKAARKTLRAALGAWKDAKDAEDRRRIAEAQEVENAAARMLQQATVGAVERIAAAEPDPIVQQAFTREAASIAAQPAAARPVELTPQAPKIAGGHFTQQYRANVKDVRKLLTAWLDGKCFLDETALIAGLQSQLDRQAETLKQNLAHAFPGVEVECKSIPVTRRAGKTTS